MPSCKEVARLIASEELIDAGWPKRVLVRLHLLMCRDCLRYAAQLRAISAATRERWGTRPEDKQILERLERSILERCLGAPDDHVEERRSSDPEPPATDEARPN